MQIRQMDVIISDLAQKFGLMHERYSSNWIHVLKKDDISLTISGYKFSLNDAAASRTASDKVATYEMLSGADIAALPHILLRKQAGQIVWYGSTYAPYVIKPLTGTGGHKIFRIESKDGLEEYILSSDDNSWAASPFTEISREVRVIILDGKILLAYEKIPVEINNLKMFNLSLGAQATSIKLPDEARLLAERAMKALNLRIAAVDLIQTSDGRWMILEMNDGFSLEKYMKQGSVYEEKGARVYSEIVSTVFGIQ